MSELNYGQGAFDKLSYSFYNFLLLIWPQLGYIGGERISGATRSVTGSDPGLKPNLPFLDEPAKSERDLLARGIFTTVAI